MKQMIMIKVALVIIFITIMAMMSSCAVTQKWGGNPGIGGHCGYQKQYHRLNYDF